jgi:1-deoxy-D-xylulose-5-phosphate synthase
MAMGGLKPVVAFYSTFFARAFDQANLDVGLLDLPVVFVFDRAGITGDDGPSHHGVLDLALCLAIPNMTIFAPSNASEVPVMLSSALALTSPSAIRFPKTPPRPMDGRHGEGLRARRIQRGDGSVCVLALGKMAANAYEALDLVEDPSRITLYDVRVLPPDPDMIDDALRHDRVITIEDGTRHGGAGTLMVSAVRSRAQELAHTFPTTRILGAPRAYLEHHSADGLLAEIGLDPSGIAGAIDRLLRDEAEFPRELPESPRPRFL